MVFMVRQQYRLILMFRKKALKGYARGEEPITCRPAEILEPELEQAKADVKDLAVDIDDEIIYALYPVTGKKFLKWKYGKEEPPPEVRARTLEEALKEQELVAKAKAGQLVEKAPKDVPQKGESLREFNVFVDNDYFNVGVEEIGGSPVISYVQPSMASPAVMPVAPVVAPAQPAPPAPAAPAESAAPAAVGDVKGTDLLSPMPGMIVSYDKKVGDTVKEGETVVILEAMKMENALLAPASGTVTAINFSSGDSVAKNDVLCVIG